MTFAPKRTSSRYLETFLFVTSDEVGITAGIQLLEARDDAEHLTRHKPASHNKELSIPKCQQ
jgi:hypothetical protein